MKMCQKNNDKKLKHLKSSSSKKMFTDQRNLGMSMKVERSSLDQVKKRFEMNKKKKEEKKRQYDFDERMKEMKQEVDIINFSYN